MPVLVSAPRTQGLASEVPVVATHEREIVGAIRIAECIGHFLFFLPKSEILFSHRFIEGFPDLTLNVLCIVDD